MTWQEIIADTNVWVHEYSVPGYSQVNAFAVVMDEYNLAIVSPPTQMSEADFAAIDEKGRVTALIAPHSGHYLGQAEWQAQYPNAQSYAPTVALKQLNSLGLQPFAPLSKLPSTPNIEFREVPGTKKGGTLVIVSRDRRPIIYLDELVCNFTSLPTAFLARVLFRLHDSAPGLKINRVYLKYLCSDVQLLVQTVVDALKDDPVIVLAHGKPLVNLVDLTRVRELVESLKSD
ncbi:hypothetical protein IQ247_02055 [Plectonema cf. radiosum LEGE 06105]|uniref:Uncharacterized protein n=1 Tax=Plectonema cf. radiosum LEGE 06105 TaxID=945769 RepID=A0A8J7FC23_9CYAN|nr:hypothetical protein [Plectonema radiosum]MBE9211511.1 hypothetical protein [Plectonema cf. radiosum LEGE 06105]